MTAITVKGSKLVHVCGHGVQSHLSAKMVVPRPTRRNRMRSRQVGDRPGRRRTGEVRGPRPRPARRHRRAAAPGPSCSSPTASASRRAASTPCCARWSTAAGSQTDPTGSVYQLGIHSLVVSSAYLDGDPVLSRAAVGAGRGRRRHRGDRAPRSPRRRRRHLHRQARVRAPAAHALRGRPPAARRTPPRWGGRCSPSSPRRVREALVPETIGAITPTATTDKDAVLRSSNRASLRATRWRARSRASGVRCFGVALPFARTTRRRPERRGADQPPRHGARGPHHRDPAQREGPARRRARQQHGALSACRFHPCGA